MPFTNLAAQIAEGGGFWAFAGAVFTASCFAAVGMFKTLSAGKIARDTNLAERENKLIEHLSGEIERLNSLVINLDGALKRQASQHSTELAREREECNAKMAALKTEIELLKRRMSEEEQRSL